MRRRVLVVGLFIARLLARFGLEEYGRNTARMLSGGLKRRLQIARSLINSPRVD